MHPKHFPRLYLFESTVYSGKTEGLDWSDMGSTTRGMETSSLLLARKDAYLAETAISMLPDVLFYKPKCPQRFKLDLYVEYQKRWTKFNRTNAAERYLGCHCTRDRTINRLDYRTETESQSQNEVDLFHPRPGYPGKAISGIIGLYHAEVVNIDKNYVKLIGFQPRR